MKTIKSNLERMCEKCNKINPISLENDHFICSRCGHLNNYDKEEMKLAMDDLMRKVRQIQFKNPKNN